MEKVKFHHNYENRPKAKAEPCIDKKSLTSSVGYVPIEARMKEMEMSGRRLMAARLGAYDTDVGKISIDDNIDPSRIIGYDLSDSTSEMNALTEKIKSQFNAKEVKNDEARANDADKGNAGVTSAPEASSAQPDGKPASK